MEEAGTPVRSTSTMSAHRAKPSAFAVTKSPRANRGLFSSSKAAASSVLLYRAPSRVSSRTSDESVVEVSGGRRSESEPFVQFVSREGAPGFTQDRENPQLHGRQEHSRQPVPERELSDPAGVGLVTCDRHGRSVSRIVPTTAGNRTALLWLACDAAFLDGRTQPSCRRRIHHLALSRAACRTGLSA